MSSEQLGAAQNVLKGNLGGAWDITNGYQDAYTDLGIARRFGGAAAAYSLRDIGAMNGPIVKVRRSADDVEEDFSASQVDSGVLENWVNGKLDSTLPADVATAAAAFSLRKVSSLKTIYNQSSFPASDVAPLIKNMTFNSFVGNVDGYQGKDNLIKLTMDATDDVARTPQVAVGLNSYQSSRTGTVTFEYYIEPDSPLVGGYWIVGNETNQYSPEGVKIIGGAWTTAVVQFKDKTGSSTNTVYSNQGRLLSIRDASVGGEAIRINRNDTNPFIHFSSFLITATDFSLVRIRRSSDNIEVNVGFDEDKKVSLNSLVGNVNEEGGDIGITNATTLGNFLTQSNNEVGTAVNGTGSFDNYTVSNLSATGFSADNSSGGTGLAGFPYVFKDNDVIVVRYTVSNFSSTSSLSPQIRGTDAINTVTSKASGGTIFTANGTYIDTLTASGDGTHFMFADGNTGSYTISDFQIVSHNNSAFVHTWYDQSGANEAIEATAANQPKIAENGLLFSLAFYTSDFSSDADGIIANTGGITVTGNNDSIFGKDNVLKIENNATAAPQLSTTNSSYISSVDGIVEFEYYVPSDNPIVGNYWHLGTQRTSGGIEIAYSGKGVEIVGGAWTTARLTYGSLFGGNDKGTTTSDGGRRLLTILDQEVPDGIAVTVQANDGDLYYISSFVFKKDNVGINFDGDTFLNIGADLMNGTDGTTFMVASNIDIDQETFYLSNRDGSTGFHFKNDASFKGKLSYNFIGSNNQISTNAVVPDSSNDKQLFGFVKDSNDTELFNNAVQLADGSSSQTYSASSGANTSIGKQGNSSSAGANKTLVLNELISYDSDQTANRFKIESNINNYYGLYNDSNNSDSVFIGGSGSLYSPTVSNATKSGVRAVQTSEGSGWGTVGFLSNKPWAIDEKLFVSFNAVIADGTPSITVREDNTSTGNIIDENFVNIVNGFNSYEFTCDTASDTPFIAFQDSEAYDITISDFKISRIERNGFVPTWYDQSTSGNNCTQSVASLQPYIVDNGTFTGVFMKEIVGGSEPNARSLRIDDIQTTDLGNNFGLIWVGTVDDTYSPAHSTTLLGANRNIITQNQGTVGLNVKLSGDEFVLKNETSGSANVNSGFPTISYTAGDRVSVAGTCVGPDGDGDHTLKAYVNGATPVSNNDTLVLTDSADDLRIMASNFSNTVRRDRSTIGKVDEVIIFASNIEPDMEEVRAEINNHYNIY